MKNIQNFIYYENKKKYSIKVELCDTPWKKFKGLMFKKKSLPLLFPFKKNQTLSIHSFFCKPFKAIWIDDKKQITREIIIKNWRPNFSGDGKYILEIPLSREK